MNQDENFVYAVSERFLFDKEPILALQANVKAIVQSHNQEKGSIMGNLFRSVGVYFGNITTRAFEPPVPVRNKRLWWKCVRDPLLCLPWYSFMHVASSLRVTTSVLYFQGKSRKG